MDEILEILEKDARMSAEEIAKCTKQDAKSVKRKIKKYEKDGVIVGYKTIINKELVRSEHGEVRALIEVNVLPQKNLGFDHIAERIFRFEEVTSWGERISHENLFTLGQSRCLNSGKIDLFQVPDDGVNCPLVNERLPYVSLCIPLQGQNEVMGVISLVFADLDKNYSG